MRIGFIGLGNMATAIIGGLLAQGIVEPGDVIGSAKTEATRQAKATQFGIAVTADNREVAAAADVEAVARLIAAYICEWVGGAAS